MNLKDKRVLITGGSGFLGRCVVKRLLEEGAIINDPRSYHYNLVSPGVAINLMQAFEPHIVIHLAAVCGGIGANQKEPGRFFYENIMMGVQLIEAARSEGVEKFVQLGTVCAYPKFTPAPFKEEDLWNGYPEETNAPYGIAKKALLVQCQAYRQQYGMNAIYLLPVNLYGPRDNFDLETSHVIPALIRKCLEAKASGAESITVWGTGSASREFLYVEDCADAILKATKSYDGAEPVNIGSGSEISLKDLVETIKSVTGYEGKVVYDASRPDGQPRRQLDTTRAEKLFDFRASTDLLSGLRLTTEWYLEHLLSD